MISTLLKQAFQSLLANPFRTFLTILGVIIGISSVILFMALGEGLRQDIKQEITSLGSNLLFVIPGTFDPEQGPAASTNLLSGDLLKPADLAVLEGLPQVEAASAFGLMGGILRHGDQIAPNTLLTGATPNLPEVFGTLQIDRGRFFTDEENQAKSRVIVLGPGIATKLFDDQNPIGQTVQISLENFTVIGVTKVPESTSILGGSDYSTWTLVPLETSGDFTNGVNIMRILLRLDPSLDPAEEVNGIREALLANHAPEEFSVVTQDQILGLLDKILDLLTAAIAAIAAISLVVAGVGIMNIMLVSVSERTREIGLRKAVGAPNRAILVQFLIEAIALTLLGALFALIFAYLAAAAIAAASPIQPVITWQAVGLAVGVAIIVGLVFGLMPAIRAAKLDPIEALRYE